MPTQAPSFEEWRKGKGRKKRLAPGTAQLSINGKTFTATGKQIREGGSDYLLGARVMANEFQKPTAADRFRGGERSPGLLDSAYREVMGKPSLAAPGPKMDVNSEISERQKLQNRRNASSSIGAREALTADLEDTDRRLGIYGDKTVGAIAMGKSSPGMIPTGPGQAGSDEVSRRMHEGFGRGEVTPQRWDQMRKQVLAEMEAEKIGTELSRRMAEGRSRKDAMADMKKEGLPTSARYYGGAGAGYLHGDIFPMKGGVEGPGGQVSREDSARFTRIESKVDDLTTKEAALRRQLTGAKNESRATELRAELTGVRKEIDGRLGAEDAKFRKDFQAGKLAQRAPLGSVALTPKPSEYAVPSGGLSSQETTHRRSMLRTAVDGGHITEAIEHLAELDKASATDLTAQAAGGDHLTRYKRLGPETYGKVLLAEYKSKQTNDDKLVLRGGRTYKADVAPVLEDYKWGTTRTTYKDDKPDGMAVQRVGMMRRRVQPPRTDEDGNVIKNKPYGTDQYQYELKSPDELKGVWGKILVEQLPMAKNATDKDRLATQISIDIKRWMTAVDPKRAQEFIDSKPEGFVNVDFGYGGQASRQEGKPGPEALSDGENKVSGERKVRGLPLTTNVIDEYLGKAGGDPDKAMEMAKQDGYNVNG